MVKILPKIRTSGLLPGAYEEHSSGEQERRLIADARERANELRLIGNKLSPDAVKSWIVVALSDADVGCAHGLGVLGRPLTVEERKIWLRELVRVLPDVPRVLQATTRLPADYRERYWWAR